jgi:hypothetical protein
MSLCEANDPIVLATGGCRSQARWVGLDGRVRCSLHQVQKYGHSERLIRVEGYQPPAGAPEPVFNGDEKLPGTHAALDALAAERGIDLGDATTVAEKKAAIESAS